MSSGGPTPTNPFGSQGARTLNGWHSLTGVLATRLPSYVLSAIALNRQTSKNLARRRHKP